MDDQFPWEVLIGFLATVFAATGVAFFGRKNLLSQMQHESDRESRQRAHEVEVAEQERRAEHLRGWLIPIQESVSVFVAALRGYAIDYVEGQSHPRQAQMQEMVVRFNTASARCIDDEMILITDEIGSLAREAFTTPDMGDESEDSPTLLDRIAAVEPELYGCVRRLMVRADALLLLETRVISEK